MTEAISKTRAASSGASERVIIEKASAALEVVSSRNEEDSVMDILDVLRDDHTDIRRLLNEIVNQTSTPTPKRVRLDRSEDWGEALHDFKLSLLGHNRAEEAVLYSLLREADSEFVESKINEHRIVEELLASLERMNPGDRDWDTKLGLLKNQIEAHQAEEESTTFEKLRGTAGLNQRELLAGEFNQLRDDIVEGARYHPKGRSVVNPAGLNLET
jgi:hemerythrin superfamily protein